MGVDGGKPLGQGFVRLAGRFDCKSVVRSSREESESSSSSSELLTTRPETLFDTAGFGGDIGISYGP